MARRRTITPAYKEALQRARRDKLEQRARLIGAGVIVSISKRKNKFNRVRTTYNSVTFDSLGEAELAHKLDLRKAAGEILDWKRPKPIVLVDASKARERITMIPDFEVWPDPINPTYSYMIDYKGSRITETASFRLKVRLLRAFRPDIELRVVYPDGSEKLMTTGKPV